jgi:uncharacterized membrane protein HdeD (DUF308 family)
MRQIKKHPMLFLVIGVVLIIAGILITFVFTDLRDSMMNTLIGAIIIILASVLAASDLRVLKRGPVFVLKMSVFVVSLVVGVLFILGTASGNPSLWIGLLLYVHGLAELVARHMTGTRLKTDRFVLSVVLLTVGTYIAASNAVSTTLLHAVLLALFVVPGLFLIVNTFPKTKRKKTSKS